MQIALAQINPIVGDLEHNFKLIVSNIEKARAENADLVIFPELALLGYPPKDLLLKPSFFEKQNYFLDELALYSDKDFGIIVGAATTNEGFGKSLHNSLVFFQDGKQEVIASKTLLPNYDVFDETRYFAPAKKVTVAEYKGVKLGLSICEDIWLEAYPLLYNKDPIGEMVAEGAEIIINASASPYVSDKPERRVKLLENIAKRFKVPVIYLNQIGSDDQLVFDGKSRVLCPSEKGIEITHSMKSFEEDFILLNAEELLAKNATSADVENSKLELIRPEMSAEKRTEFNLEQIRSALVLGIRDYVRKSGFEQVLIGLSGGIDSALVACLAKEALGAENVYGIGMPSKYSSEGSVSDAEELAKNLGINFELIPIKSLHLAIDELLPELEGLADENVQPRLRANILMAISNSRNALVLATGNKSEIAVGYFTIYGDSCGALAPIGDVLKTRVYELSEFINRKSQEAGGGIIIPENIIEKHPSAELRPDQKDQDSLPEYEVLDEIVRLYVEEMKSLQEIVDSGFDRELVVNILNRIDRNEHKRFQLPPSLKIAGRAFGLGRRMPIVQNYKHGKPRLVQKI